MKYNIGDTVFLKGEVIGFNTDYSNPYHVEFEDGTDDWIFEYDLVDEVKDYDKGLEDAWELAKKICYGMTHITFGELKEIFGLPNNIGGNAEILCKLTPQEAFAKIKAYEEAKDGIKVGDVVYADDSAEEYGVVTMIHQGLVYVLWFDGSSGAECRLEELHKVGRSVNDKVRQLLDELKEGAE